MIVYLPGAVDAQQAVGERLGDSEYFVDSRRLADEVWIKCADDDARMVETVVVKANEMLAIEGEEDSSLRAGEREHLVVRHGLAGFTRVDNGQDVVAQSAQFQDYGEREVLVGVKSRHGSSGLVLLDLTADLLSMGPGVSPGVHEILGP